MDNLKIGQFLRDLRIKDGLSQKDVADICNVSHQAVSKWEKGGSVPDISSLKQLSEHYKINIDDILEGETRRSQQKPLPNNQNKEIIKITLSVFIIIAGFLPFLQTNEGIYHGYELLLMRDFGLGIITFVSLLSFVLFQITFSVFMITRVISFSFGNISLNRSLSVVLMVLTWFTISISALIPFPFVLFLLYLVGIYLINTKVLHTIDIDSQVMPRKTKYSPFVYLGIYFSVLSILPVYLLFFDEWFQTVNLMVYPVTILLYLTSVLIFAYAIWKKDHNPILSKQAKLISVHTMRLLYLFFFYLMYTQSEFFNITENSYDAIMYIIIYIGFELYINSKYVESLKQVK